MRVVIQKPDLDTCLAGAALGIADTDLVIYRTEGATNPELEDATVICIEAGGSGQVDKRNFDHHDTNLPLPPACVQAYAYLGRPPEYESLVEYAEMVDQCQPSPRRPSFPSVSSLISGIRFVHASEPVLQFREGTRALRLIAARGIDPFETLPWLPEWDPYLAEKSRRLAELANSSAPVEFVKCGGTAFAFSINSTIGAVGALFHHGADVAVVGRQRQTAGTWKYTIAGNGIRVRSLLPELNKVECGWGGPAHGTIIGSPFKGSVLPFETVREIVLTGFGQRAGGPHLNV